MDEGFEKIRFEKLDGKFYRWLAESAETLWAKALGNNLFRIDNHPFFIREIAIGDIICALLSDGRLVAEDVYKDGGHGTIRIRLLDGTTINTGKRHQFWSVLSQNGCTYEGLKGERVYSIDIAPTSNLAEVFKSLDDAVKEKVWVYDVLKQPQVESM